MPFAGVQTRRFDQRRQPAPTSLNSFQAQTIGLFVRGADALSLPRAAGQVHGLLFATPHPLDLDQMTTLFNASGGGTWEGPDWLRQMGAVEEIFLPGARKDH
jgi:DNA-binding transcriptional regulator GbsR (MarR family)